MRRIFISMLVVGALAGAPWALTQAAWTDSQAVDSNAFSTGTVDISTGATSSVLTFSNAKPGDKTTSALTVTNGGTLNIAYSMATSITGSSPLASGITVTVKSGVTTCTDAGFSASGTSLYSGTLPSAALSARSLSAGSNDPLCMQAELPSDAASSLQGLSATATFTFSAQAA